MMLLANVFVVLMVRICQTEQRFCENMFADVGEMFLIIAGSIALGTFVWFLLRKDPEPLLGVYSQPGIIYSGMVLPYHYWKNVSCLSVCLSICFSSIHRFVFYQNGVPYRLQNKTRQRGSRRRRHNSASMSGSQLSISKIQYKLLSNEISERFPVPVRLAFQLNLTAWLHQNLSKRFLNTSTELASTTQSGKLFHIFTTLGVNEYLRTS